LNSLCFDGLYYPAHDFDKCKVTSCDDISAHIYEARTIRVESVSGVQNNFANVFA